MLISQNSERRKVAKWEETQLKNETSYSHENHEALFYMCFQFELWFKMS